MLQSGNNQNAKSSVAPVGVLQCASNSCKLRVIRASTWNCCKACSASNRTAHDKECLQVPLEGYATRDDWLCSQRIAKRSCTTLNIDIERSIIAARAHTCAVFLIFIHTCAAHPRGGEF